MNETDANALTQPALQVCANCQTPGADRYCGHCGQRLDTHIQSVWHFTAEATEVLTHADSRVWNTLRPLLTQPGFLSREFFAGRRARYLQPFRLYIVLSVIFLLLANWLSEKPQTVNLTAGDAGKVDCRDVKTDLPGAQWLRPRLIDACQKLKAGAGAELGQSVVHNLGRAMFVFLPLMALFMKLLYWRPRRYYLEHLLLLLHNHAFVFLWMSVYLVAMHWLKSMGGQSLLSLVMGGLLILYAVCGGFMLLATALISAVTL